ncbi:unnamed protein product, partial [Prorocentrum cordatum]
TACARRRVVRAALAHDDQLERGQQRNRFFHRLDFQCLVAWQYSDDQRCGLGQRGHDQYGLVPCDFYGHLHGGPRDLSAMLCDFHSLSEIPPGEGDAPGPGRGTRRLGAPHRASLSPCCARAARRLAALRRGHRVAHLSVGQPWWACF